MPRKRLCHVISSLHVCFISPEARQVIALRFCLLVVVAWSSPSPIASLFLWRILGPSTISAQSASFVAFWESSARSIFTEAETMLAMFSEAIAHGPEALSSPGQALGCSGELAAKFQSKHPQVASVGFEGKSYMAYTHEKQALLTPRTFAAVDDIYCIFVGVLENLPELRQRYGMSKSVNEALLVIEAYRALRDRAPYPPDQVVGDLSGHFGFVLYDNHTKKIFVAADMFGKVPLFWGITSDELIAFSDDKELIKSTCGKSNAVFPQGCYFSSNEGLRSFEHPLHEVKAVPQIDGHGQASGSTFKVDVQRGLAQGRTGNINPWGVV